MKNFRMNDFPVFVNWVNTFTRIATKTTYTFVLKTYCEWLDKTPDEIIDEADDEQEKLKMRNRHVAIYLNQFRDHLISQKLAPYSVKTYLSAVRSFYQANYIDIPKIKIDKPTGLRENRDIPSKEDLQNVLKVCDPLEKTVLLVGASAGLGAQEIVNLKVGDFKNGFDPVTEIGALRLLRVKENVDFITFLSPEATRAVNEYLDFRARTVKTENVKRLRQLEKQKVFSSNDYLFCIRRIPDEFLNNHDDSLRKFTTRELLRTYQGIAEKARKNTDKGNWGFIRSHNIIKYFNSTLLNAGCDFFHVEFFMGHTLPSTQGHYFRASPEKLKEIYKRYVPYLTIQKDLDISESPEYLAIKNENAVLRTETARVHVERQELQELRNEIEKLKQTATEATQQEETFDKIIAGEMCELNKGPDFDDLEKVHAARYNKDPEYKKRFDEAENVFFYGVYDAPECEGSYLAYKKQKNEEREKLENLNKLLDEKLKKYSENRSV